MARKCEFDHDVVLSNAMTLFWEEGYFQASMAKLVEVTGLKPGSIYAAFQSKEGLFASSLALYGQQSVAQLRSCLDQAPTKLLGVTDFIRALGREIISDRRNRGCFLVNTALELSPHNERIRLLVNEQMEAIETLIADAFEAAREEGELSAAHEPAALAKYVMVNIWGLRVLRQTTSDKNAIQSSLDLLLSLLEPPDAEIRI